MSAPNPIPSGADLVSQWEASKPAAPAELPKSWTAQVLLTPFGDSISPLPDYAQLVAATVEVHNTDDLRWMRARLYLTVSEQYFDFLFVTGEQDSAWYWVDSTPAGTIQGIFGPFQTTLSAPQPKFLAGFHAQWGNRYPLMCTDTNPTGIACDHWVAPTPGAPDHGGWYTFRRDTGNLFRIFMMDATNPLMLPILGSFYISNVASFAANAVSQESQGLVQSIGFGGVTARPDYWNPLVSQQDIHRAMAYPLAVAPCSRADIQGVIPGFSAKPAGVPLPEWTHQTYIEAWTLGTDFIPYFTRVCYLWTGDDQSKQQTIFIGLGTLAGQGTYLVRSDTCLNTTGTKQPYYEWQAATNDWKFTKCLEPNPPVGLPFPDWVARDQGVVMGQIVGNANFGLKSGETLNLIAAELPRGGGELAIFWLWFLASGAGMMFTEGNFMNPLSHNLQIIDYNLFVQNALITQADFTNPCATPAAPKSAQFAAARGHLMRSAM